MNEFVQCAPGEIDRNSGSHSPLVEPAPPATSADKTQTDTPSPSDQSSLANGMFSIGVRSDLDGRVVIMGKPSRKHANAFLNIPISQQTRHRLDEQLVGSLSMATSALIEWALNELKRQAVTLEVRPQR